MTRGLRIAVVIDGLGWGGAEMLLADFAVGARAAGMDLVVGYLEEKDGSPAAGRLRALGVRVELLGVDRLLAPSALPTLRRWLARVRPDVVHTHLGYSDLLGGLAARSLGIPATCTLHVLQWHHGRWRDDLKEALFGLGRRRCMRRVLAVSDAARAVYLATGRDRADRVLTVHNGVVDHARAGAGAAVRTELGLASDDLVLVMVAVLRAGKGHDVAIEAAAELRGSRPEVRLVIVGDGPERDRLARAAAPLGEAVVLTGHRDDVPAVLDAADVLVHPTEFDAFPTSLLEAAAAGTPVVATAVGGIPEIVDDGITGVLLPAPASRSALVDAVRVLADDPDRRTGMGRAARERFVAHFTAESWGRRMGHVYDVVRAR